PVAVALACHRDDADYHRVGVPLCLCFGPGAAALEDVVAFALGDSLLDQLFDPHLRLDGDLALQRLSQRCFVEPGPDPRAALVALYSGRGVVGVGLRLFTLYDPADLRRDRSAGSEPARGGGRFGGQALADLCAGDTAPDGAGHRSRRLAGLCARVGDVCHPRFDGRREGDAHRQLDPKPVSQRAQLAVWLCGKRGADGFGGFGVAALQTLFPPGRSVLTVRRRGLRVAAGLYVALIFLFLYLPIGILVLFSFNRSLLRTVWTGFTLDWYRELFSDDGIWRATSNSLI